MYLDFVTLQVLSGTVSNTIKLTGRADAQATAVFIEMIDKFFDCLNVDNYNEGKKAKKVFKSHIPSRMIFV